MSKNANFNVFEIINIETSKKTLTLIEKTFSKKYDN